MLTYNKLLNQPAISIIHPNKSAYSETFIKSHIERLPARVGAIHYGNWSFPFYQQNDRPLIELGFGSRLLRLTQRKIFGRSPAYFQAQSLISFLRNQKVQVVLAEYGQTGVCIMDACKEANIPFVVHFHGFDAYDQSILDKFSQAYQLMFDKASAIIAVSHDMEQQLLNLGAPKNKLVYNPCGVDISLFAPGDIASSAPLFVAVGRFVDKKAPYLTLLAFQKVVKVFSAAKLIMVGDGYLLESCKQLAKAIGIADNVQFTGSLTHSEVVELLRNARAFLQHSIQTSYGDSEGTPVALLEAGAAGLPVISTKHTGIADVVIPNQTGLLVEEGDIDGMAEAIIALAKDVELASKLGKAARERISENFSMERSIKNLWNVLETKIQKHQNFEFRSS